MNDIINFKITMTFYLTILTFSHNLEKKNSDLWNIKPELQAIKSELWEQSQNYEINVKCSFFIFNSDVSQNCGCIQELSRKKSYKKSLYLAINFLSEFQKKDRILSLYLEIHFFLNSEF